MKEIILSFDSVLREAKLAETNKDGEAYNFLKSANSSLKVLEDQYDHDYLVDILIDYLTNLNINQPGARHLLSMLFRLISIDNYSDLQYKLVEQGVSETEIESSVYPAGFIKVLSRYIGSKRNDIAMMSLQYSGKVGTVTLRKKCLRLATNIKKASAIRSYAVLALTETPLTDVDQANTILEMFYKEKNKQLKTRCFEILFTEHYDGSELEAKVLKKYPKLLSEYEYLRSFLDLCDSRHEKVIIDVSKKIKLEKQPDDILRKMQRNKIIPRDLRRKCDAIVKMNVKAVVAEINENYAGLLIHRDSGFSGLWVGHSGIYIGNNDVIHLTTGHDPYACHRTSLTAWKSSGSTFWGFRRDHRHNVNLTQAINKAWEIASRRTKYDGGHNNQKGKWFYKCKKRHWWGGCKKRVRDYWEADCVGFTENLYERSGGNPTPSSYESGWGWPLTVREQRDRMQLVSK